MRHCQIGEHSGRARESMSSRRFRVVFLIWVSMAAVMAAGCASAPPKPEPKKHAASTYDDIGKELKKGAEQPRVPADVSEALLPPVELPGGQATLEAEEPRFDISATKMPAREFFMSLMKGTPYNIVVHPEVKGNISLTLKNVTVDEVLGVVRDIYGYEFDHDKDLYKIYPPRLQSRIYQVSYINVKLQQAFTTICPKVQRSFQNKLQPQI